MAKTIQTNIPGLSVTKNDYDDIWLNFISETDGKQTSINMDDMAYENLTGIAGQAVKEWCNDVRKAIKRVDSENANTNKWNGDSHG